jgi:UDP-N-acetylglucosamine diphosphorylase / glucose-1-phosphate thymidylyltransferase / UDP-N-acetylgalactosamine diphosphorylase / glucosamine-1-phosphate N-acetyltransferase / galactosamine-1-phosphate N-acetyltransferase
MLAAFIAGFGDSALAPFADAKPWELTRDCRDIVERLLARLADNYAIAENVAVHTTAVVEPAAVIKGPAIIGPRCLIAAGAYLRGGCWLEADCVLGPGAELKSSLVFAGSKLAHFNFVGDSVLGHNVNLEAGAVIANYRNERGGAAISFVYQGKRIDTGVDKFGALVGDGTKLGANAVIAPGAFIAPGTVVPRLSLIEQG